MIPYDEHMGFHTTVRAPGDAVVEADVGAHLHNPMGILHGGVLVGMMDSAMGAAMTSLLEPGETTTNMEFHVRFLRPTVEGHLRATAHIIKQGRLAVVWEATVTNEEGDEVARATSTFLKLR